MRAVTRSRPLAYKNGLLGTLVPQEWGGKSPIATIELGERTPLRRGAMPLTAAAATGAPPHPQGGAPPQAAGSHLRLSVDANPRMSQNERRTEKLRKLRDRCGLSEPTVGGVLKAISGPRKVKSDFVV
jgi:hypothetical protein